MSIEALEIQPLTQAAFAPYGDVIESDERESFSVPDPGRLCALR